MKVLYNSEVKIPSIKHVGIVYLISIGLFIGVGEFLSTLKIPNLTYELQMAFIVAVQVLFVFIPVLIYTIINKINIKRTFRINKVSLVNIFTSIFIMMFAIPIASVLNAVIIIILSYFGKVQEPVIFPTENIYQLVTNILVIAMVPAIFEEIFFRGMVLRAYEKLGNYKAIVISSLLFALMHRDIQSLVGTFILGVVITYIVYRTNSIFAGMIAHFTNNSLIIFMTFISSKYQSSVSEYNPNIMDQFAGYDISIIISMIIILIMILLVVIGIFVGLIFLFRYNTRNINHDNIEIAVASEEKNINIPILTSVILVAYVFIKQII